MKETSLVLVCLLGLVLASPGASAADNAADARDKAAIISIILSSHRGHCICPYQLRRDGKQCGKGSLYKRRPGSVACYAKEVTRAMLKFYRTNP
jgi:hypothetical protein